MTDQFVGEIRMVGFNFPPQGWAYCNGQILPISQNTALFSLLGTFYGGNGTSNFALPNLQGLTPVDQGQGAGLSGYFIGETGGEASVALNQSQIAAHTHTLESSPALGTTPNPSGGDWAVPRGLVYGTGTGAQLNPGALAMTGGGAPHNNVAPYLALNFVIALVGIFPPRS
jgi:microcystin-dependent protein